MRRLFTLLFVVSCASPKPAPQQAMQFDEAPILEPEAGPAALVDSETEAEKPAAEAPDTGPVAVIVSDAGMAKPDLGRPDAGRLEQPLLPDEAAKARFEGSLKKALDDPAGAESEFEALASAYPSFYFAHYNAALCRIRRGDAEGGRARLRQVHDRFGDVFHGATEALAWIQFRNGDREGAAELLRGAMERHDRVLGLRNAYGRMLLELGRFEDAGALAMKTLKKDEVNVGAMQVLGWSFCKRDKMELCLLVLGNALKVPGEQSNGMTSYLASLAYLKFAKGAQKLTAEARVRRSHGYLAVAARAMPDRPEVLINYARVLLDKGDAPEAYVLSNRATLLRPDLVEGWIVKGVAQRDKGDYLGARKTLLKVFSDHPQRVEVLYNLGILYLDHDLAAQASEELCPDVSLEDMKQEVGSDLFDGVAVKHLNKKMIDPLRRLRQASIYLERFREGSDLSSERDVEVEKQLRAAKKAIRTESKKRARAIKRAKRDEKRAKKRKKRMQREQEKQQAEAAAAAAVPVEPTEPDQPQATTPSEDAVPEQLGSPQDEAQQAKPDSDSSSDKQNEKVAPKKSPNDQEDADAKDDDKAKTKKKGKANQGDTPSEPSDKSGQEEQDESAPESGDGSEREEK
jgi:Flp pilus assembly protein TadD